MGDWRSKVVRPGTKGTAVIGSGSRVFALGAQFVIVIILTKLLGKSTFGNFMVVFAGYRLLANGIGTGLAAVLLYHIPRADQEDALVVRLHRATLLIGAVVAGLLCVALCVWATPLAAAFDKPDLALWMRAMAPFLFFTMLATVTTGAFEGRRRVATAILLTEVLPNGIRLLLLGALFFLNWGDIWVAHIMAISIAVPWLVAIRDVLDPNIRGIARLSPWDFGYAGKLTLYNFAAMQVQGIDMIVAGWLFSADSVADYAIASRVAALFPFFQQLKVRMFGPVGGRLLASGDREGLQKEANAAKDFSMVFVTLTVAGLLLASPLFLKLIWGAGSLSTLLVLMAFAPAYRTLFAIGDRLLQVAGHANWNLGIMLAALAIVVAVPFAFGHQLGIMSLPIGMMVSSFALNPVIAFGVARLTGIRLLRPADALTAAAIGLCVGLPLLLGTGEAKMFLSGGLFLLLGLALGMKQLTKNGTMPLPPSWRVRTL